MRTSAERLPVPPSDARRDPPAIVLRPAPARAALATGPRPTALVVGFGPLAGGDAAAGPEVVRLMHGAVPAGVRLQEGLGGAAALVEAWRDVPLVIAVGAIATGAPAGTISRVEVLPGACLVLAGLRAVTPPSTRGTGLDEALALGCALGRLPRRLVVVGIEGRDGRPGGPSSAPVRRAVHTAARRLLAELLRG